jgi:hypothetical protein
MPMTKAVASGKLSSLSQVRAMFAAAEGKSNLGIPMKVGKEMTAGAGMGLHKGLLSSLPNKVNKKKRAVRAKGLV